MLNIKRKIKNKKGMTLVEVAVAFAMIAIFSVVIIIGFNTMGNIVKDSSDADKLDERLEKEIALSGTSKSSTPTSITLDDGNIEIEGVIKEYQLDEDGRTRTFRVFEANE